MDEKRREEIGIIVSRFRGKPMTQDSLTEFCNLNKIQPITLGDYSDYLYQVEHDEIVTALFPQILAKVQELRYTPEFATAKERAEIKESNEEVRIEMSKLIEQAGITYITVATIGEEFSNIIGGTIASAGQTVFNRAKNALLQMAREKFGGEYTVKHSADYLEEFFKKLDEAEKTNAVKE